MNRRPLRLLGVLACVLTTACTVGFWDYPRIEAPFADYINVGCDGDGPPKRAYYPFHGIYIAVELEPLALSLHVPRRIQVSLDRDPVVVTGTTPQGPVTLTQSLGPTGKHVLADTGMTIFDFEPRRDEPRPPGQGNPDAIVDRIRRGNLRLPGMTINGEHYPAQDLPFERRTWRRAMVTSESACARSR